MTSYGQLINVLFTKTLASQLHGATCITNRIDLFSGPSNTNASRTHQLYLHFVTKFFKRLIYTKFYQMWQHRLQVNSSVGNDISVSCELHRHLGTKHRLYFHLAFQRTLKHLVFQLWTHGIVLPTWEASPGCFCNILGGPGCIYVRRSSGRCTCVRSQKCLCTHCRVSSYSDPE